MSRDSNMWYCMQCTQSIFAFNHYEDDNDFMSAITTKRTERLSVDQLSNRLHHSMLMLTKQSIPLVILINVTIMNVIA